MWGILGAIILLWIKSQPSDLKSRAFSSLKFYQRHFMPLNPASLDFNAAKAICADPNACVLGGFGPTTAAVASAHNHIDFE